MGKIYLSDYPGTDDRTRFKAALDFMKENPGTTLVVEPGTYNITSERAREAQRALMNGDYGENPESVMFTPDYEYDVGLDFRGHVGSTVEGYGATLLVDGFMETVSISECENVTLRGLTVDHKRRPYSKGVVTEIRRDGDVTRGTLVFSEPLTARTPLMRQSYYSPRAGRFINELVRAKELKYVDPTHFECVFRGDGEPEVGDEVYYSHTFHGRPAIFIYKAVNTLLADVTIHNHPGMGITAQESRDIVMDRLRVVPSAGDKVSTNTDATHFCACRGKVRFDGCRFEGQGDDTTNVHTYYYVVRSHGRNTVFLTITSPDGPHGMKLLCPQVGDRLELVRKESLHPEDVYRVTGVEPDRAAWGCTVTLDRDLPENLDGYYFADPDEVPDVEFVNCTMRNHHARSVLIKSRTALIENCDFSCVFESPVKIAAEGGWEEGINSELVTVRRCRFTDNGTVSNECGGVTVRMEAERPALTHGTVVIEDNLIDCPRCMHGLILENVRRAEVRRNVIVSAGEAMVVGEGVELITE